MRGVNWRDKAANQLRGSTRGRRGEGRTPGFSNSNFVRFPVELQWCLVWVGPLKDDKTLSEFLVAVSYKLQDYGFHLEEKNRLVIRCAEAKAVIRQVETLQNAGGHTKKLEFCLICAESLDVNDKSLINFGLNLPLVFASDFSNSTIENVAEGIADIKRPSTQNDPTKNALDNCQPMSMQKICLMADECDKKSDEEVLLKLTSGASFFLALDRQAPARQEDFCSAEMAVLKLVSRACRCNVSHYRESLAQLLSKFCSSWFCQSALSGRINKLNFLATGEKALIRQKSNVYRTFLIYCTSIFVDILTSMPRKVGEMIGVLMPLKSALECADLKDPQSKIFDESLEKLALRFKTALLDAQKLQITVIEEISTSTGQGNFERPPPNNFRELPVFPTRDEILSGDLPYLRKNIIKGAYESTDHYLDVQFRLLREDYIEPLRRGIASFLRPAESKNGKTDIKVYQNVQLQLPEMDKKSGEMTHVIDFGTKGMKNVRWEISKRFLHGSLLCLSPDKFEQTLFFATISDRSPEKLAKGQLQAVFEVQDPSQFLVHNREIYTMVESSAYFEAYRHILQALLAIRDEAQMPFPKYFVRCEPQVDAPLYVRRTTAGVLSAPLNFSCLVQNKAPRANYNVDVLNLASWPSETALGLDESQYAALRLALTHELAVIQGPPGTGKTFIGYKIAQVLLANEKNWRVEMNDRKQSPILVVCFTNHALDQFLEGIASFMPENIIRIGGRSKNPKMEKYLFRNLNFSTIAVDNGVRFGMRGMRNMKNQLNQRMTALSNSVAMVAKSPLNYEALSQVADRHLLRLLVQNDAKLPLSNTDIVKMWLSRDQRAYIRPLPVDLDSLRHVMYYSGMPQVACANALLVAHGDPEEAMRVLYLYHQDPRLYESGDRLAGMPPMEAIDFMTCQTCIPLEDALFALQQNGHDVHAAIAWLSDGFKFREDEIQLAQQPIENLPNDAAGAEPNVDDDAVAAAALDDFENENRRLDDEPTSDDEETQLGRILDDIQLSSDHTFFQSSSGVNTKISIPDSVWSLIVRSRPMSEAQAQLVRGDPWGLPLRDRWCLYAFWIQKFNAQCNAEMGRLQEGYLKAVRRYNEMRTLETEQMFRNAKVIGMTTTGAAKYQAVLSVVQPRIVIVEEAAEVLESHIVTSLSAGCQHVVLIGDHQQLRPSPAVYHLAKKFHLDVSLFERLINNQFPHSILNYQHRMRTEIADNLMPHFYENLKNDKSVLNHPDVKGMCKNMFFLNHNHQESQEGDSTTRKNDFEAKMAVGLCMYLTQQGYQGDQITILCCYAGQMFSVKKLMKAKFGDDKCKAIKVTVVDNYQGEECDIIILCMVRSNTMGKIGFLKTKNRICVALSRAKHGLFCLGNFDHLAACSPDLWAKVAVNLKHLPFINCGPHYFRCSKIEFVLRRYPLCFKDGGFLSETLPLKCQIHGNQSFVRRCEDFELLVPEGGCKQLCDFRLDCGHVCRKNCHSYDADHTKMKCVKDCAKMCSAGIHKCNKLCWEDCGDCLEKVEKILCCGHTNLTACWFPAEKMNCVEPCEFLLPCGHRCQDPCSTSVHTVNCAMPVQCDLPCGHTARVKCNESKMEKLSIKCKALVKKRLPDCGHEAEMFCWVDVASAKCQTKCDAVLQCEHLCQGNCFSCRRGRLHEMCTQDCGRILICGHECDSPCANNCPPCEKECAMECCHSKCNLTPAPGKGQKKGAKKHGTGPSGRKCGMPCPSCKEKCAWQCEHLKCGALCCDPCTRGRCDEPCTKNLPCKKCKKTYKCVGMCGEPCIEFCPECKKSEVEEMRSIFFGPEDEPDSRFIKLQDCGHVFEVHSLDTWVDGHLQAKNEDQPTDENSASTDRKAVKFAECPKCKKLIFKTDRYRDALKPSIAMVQGVKAKIRGDFKQLNAKKSWLIGRLDDLAESIDDAPVSSVQLKTAVVLLRKYLQDIKTADLFANVIFRLENLVNICVFLSDELERLHFPREPVSNYTLCSAAPKFHSFLADFFPSYVTSGLMSFRLFCCTLVHEDLRNLSLWIICNFKKASPQMMDEIGGESRRFCLLILTFKVIEELTHRAGSLTALEENPATAFHAILRESVEILFGKKPIDEDSAEIVREKLKLVVKRASLAELSRVEKLQIVEALHLSRGHWYSCPNGHVYCIADCGQAMEKSVCPECRAEIGGERHALVTDNKDATQFMFGEQPPDFSLDEMIRRGDEALARQLHAQLNEVPVVAHEVFWGEDDDFGLVPRPPNEQARGIGVRHGFVRGFRGRARR